MNISFTLWNTGVVTTVSFLTSILIYLIFLRDTEKNRRIQLFIVLLSISATGAVSGHFSGLSRESVVGDVMPAILTFVGGFAVYKFLDSANQSVVSALCAISFSMAFTISISVSIPYREAELARANLLEICLKSFSATPSGESAAAFCRFNSVLGQPCIQLVGDEINKIIPLESEAQRTERYKDYYLRWVLSLRDDECNAAVFWQIK